jgi:GNAT superfamily N-acetyltransferase
MATPHLTGNAVKEAIRALREEGLKGFWFKLLSEICYRRVILLERSPEETLETKPPFGVTISLLKKTEVDEYLAFHTEANPSRIADRLIAENWCFIARYEGQLIASAWAAIQRAWISYLACQISLAEGEVYFYDAVTRPDFRGQSISPIIRAEMTRYFQNAGYRRIITAVLPENKLGLQVSRKVGSRPFGMRGYIKIGPWRWDFRRINKRKYDSI